MTKRSAVQASLFADPPITIMAPGPLDPDAARLAILTYVGASSFLHICREGELDFDAWSDLVIERLGGRNLRTTEDELEWMRDHLSYEPTLKSFISTARERLNARLLAEPALPTGAVVALFMKGSVGETTSVFGPDDMPEPTALLTLVEPLYFECHRGAIFQFRASSVKARMMVEAVPSWTGDPAKEARLFVLESDQDLSINDGWVSLKYPSLNKVFPGIFRRLHVNEGKQNTNRSIYYHAAWAKIGTNGRHEYHSLWSIRDAVRQRTWTCPLPPSPSDTATFERSMEATGKREGGEGGGEGG